jgi:hypothetical protein
MVDAVQRDFVAGRGNGSDERRIARRHARHDKERGARAMRLEDAEHALRAGARRCRRRAAQACITSRENLDGTLDVDRQDVNRHATRDSVR